MNRKGITPVVAIVLLLLLTIAAAGAAFAFSQNLIEQQTEQGRQQAASSLSVKGIVCHAGSDGPGDWVLVQALNDGDVDLDGAEIFGYYLANNSLAFRNTTGNINFPADNFNERNFTLGGGNITSGTQYRVEIEFDNGYSTSDQCTGD